MRGLLGVLVMGKEGQAKGWEEKNPSKHRGLSQ